jgi:hypothetical protein
MVNAFFLFYGCVDQASVAVVKLGRRILPAHVRSRRASDRRGRVGRGRAHAQGWRRRVEALDRCRRRCAQGGGRGRCTQAAAVHWRRARQRREGGDAPGRQAVVNTLRGRPSWTCRPRPCARSRLAALCPSPSSTLPSMCLRRSRWRPGPQRAGCSSPLAQGPTAPRGRRFARPW